MLIWSAAFCLIEKVFPCLYSETTSISPTHLLLSPSQIVLLHLLNLGFNLSLDFLSQKWTCLQLSTKNLPIFFQNLLTPHLEAILKVTFKLLGTSASFTTVFALPEILPQWIKLLGHWLKNLCSIMGWYLASFLCFSLRCSSRLLADFSKRLSRVDRIFLKFPRQPLEISYFIGHDF